MPPRGSRKQRNEVLINGRRVRVADLLERGFLKPGVELTFQQRAGMQPHRATVVADGRLKLADGRLFDTPSAAAVAAAEIIAAPGWTVWRVGEAGPTLHELRQQLLRGVAEDVARNENGASAAEAIRSLFTFLEDARVSAEKGEPKTLTVRELLEFWHVIERDRAASARIDADLANHGLTTMPDFRAVSLDRHVQVVVQLATARTVEKGDAPQMEAPFN